MICAFSIFFESAPHRIAGLVLDPYLDARRFGEVIENLRWLALGKLSAIEINVNLDDAIDAAYEVDEVKAIHDQAAMLQAAARVARNVAAEMRAYEIRMRAARKAGSANFGCTKTGEFLCEQVAVRKGCRQARNGQ